MTATELNEKFAVSGALQFEVTPGGLTRAVVSTPLAEADIYLQGAHIAHWTPCGHKPVLFVSARSFYAPGKAIRGGVPVIFPWFGARSDGKPGPAHGFARSALWSVAGSRLLDNGAVEVSFVLAADDASRGLGFDGFTARFTATVGTELGMSLEVTNSGAGPFPYEEALHSYFAISSIHGVTVRGLEGTTLIDKTDGFKRKVQPDEPIVIAKETDQVHLNSTSDCVVSDPAWRRGITVAKSGSNSTVVWNPWIAKTAGMSDMLPGEWQDMVCVETANAADNSIILAPGESHTLTTTISVKATA
jgi:glucose-6-phosphate 1-epimerase